MAGSPQPPEVSLELWRPALVAALEFRTLAPWAWMDDTAISVHVDEQGAPWFACVLGNAGEVFGLVLYRGEEGFRALHALHVAETETDLEDARYLQSAIDVTFCPKNMLDRHDLQRWRELGYTPARGARLAWPSFRSHRPGCVQWHLDEGELRVLTAALPRVARFAAALRAHPNEYADRAAFEYPILADAGEPPGDCEWRHWLPPAPLPSVAVRVRDDAAAASVRQLPLARQLVLELDVCHSAIPVAEGERPYFPRQVSIVRGDNGMIVGMELLNPTSDGSVALADCLLKVIHRLGVRPHTLWFAREPLAQRFLPLAEQLDIARVSLVDFLPKTEEFRAGLNQFLR